MSVCQRIGKILDYVKSSKTRQQYCRSKSFAMKTDILMNGSMVKNHISLKKGIRIPCNTENFVPIVVPGLSNSSSDSSTSRTLSRQGSPCSTSSSSSSSSPTLSEIQSREREDRTESDISPVTVSTMVDERSGRPDIDQANKNRKNEKEPKMEQGDPLFADSGRASSEIPEWLQEFRENLVDDEIPEHGDSHASSSHEASLEPILKRREDLGKHSVHTHFPEDRNCEICRGLKLQGPRAGDATVEPYLVLKILVT